MIKVLHSRRRGNKDEAQLTNQLKTSCDHQSFLAEGSSNVRTVTVFHLGGHEMKQRHVTVDFSHHFLLSEQQLIQNYKESAFIPV